MRIAMVGAGYVGLVSGACLADVGRSVVCVDRDPAEIADLNAGRMPLDEPGLADLMAETVRQGRLAFRTGPHEAVAGAAAVFIAVGTPCATSTTSTPPGATVSAIGGSDDPRIARASARLEHRLGGVERTREDGRSARGRESLTQDQIYPRQVGRGCPGRTVAL